MSLKYIETPTQTEFDSARDAVADIASTYKSTLNTHIFSVISELLLRPLAYIYAYLKRAYDTYIQKTSISYLKTTTDTQDELADMVASNFFVTRKEGKKATGTVQLTADSASVRIPLGTRFDISGTVFTVAKTIITMLAPIDSTDTIQYVQAFPTSQGTYRAIFTVIAEEVGYVQIDTGTQVTASSTISRVTAYEVASPITGGDEVQTNQQMFQRIQSLTQAGAVSTQQSIATRLSGAPYEIISCKAYGGDSVKTPRAYYNTALVATGGCVDVFVKTDNQPVIKELQLTVASTRVIDGVTYGELIIDSEQDSSSLAGYVAILSIDSVLNTEDLTTALQTAYKVQFSSIQSDLSADSVRLSSLQRTTVLCPSADVGDIFLVSFKYVRFVQPLQTYMELPENQFLGESLLIRGAAPIKLGLQLQCTYSDTITDTLTEQIIAAVSKFINTQPVGTQQLNVSDLQNTLQPAFPGLNLRMPCTMTASLLTKDQLWYTFTSTSGVIDISTIKDLNNWSSMATYFSASEDSITIEYL